MLHIVTVHWKRDLWIDLQLGYLKRFITTPYRVYAFLNDLPARHRDKFFYTSTEPIVDHAIKLNLLADVARFNSTGPEDLLMFLDGDAFPVGDIITEIRERMKTVPLVAVQRLENNGDCQPHPCFCVTTIGFWQSIQGDWKGGYRWKNSQGEALTDVGGNLLGQLDERNVSWHPLRLTRLGRDHAMFFGVYGDLVYHHGAGFREPWSRVDDLARLSAPERLFSRGLRRLPSSPFFDALRQWIDPRAPKSRVIARTSQEVLKEIVANPDFYRTFRKVSAPTP